MKSLPHTHKKKYFCSNNTDPLDKLSAFRGPFQGLPCKFVWFNCLLFMPSDKLNYYYYSSLVSFDKPYIAQVVGIVLIAINTRGMRNNWVRWNGKKNKLFSTAFLNLFSPLTCNFENNRVLGENNWVEFLGIFESIGLYGNELYSTIQYSKLAKKNALQT